MVAVHYAYWNESEIPSDIEQAKWGDIEGTSGNPGYSSAINGIVNYCGAIVNPAWIDAGEVPVADFHGLLDTVVPADSGCVYAKFNNTTDSCYVKTYDFD